MRPVDTFCVMELSKTRVHIKKSGNLRKDSGRKFNLIIPKCYEICYNISLYQTLFVGIQQKGVDFMGKDLKGKELGVGICQRKDGLYTARFVSKRTGKSVQKYFPKLQECRKWYADAKFAVENDVIYKNPVTKGIKNNIGKEPKKDIALTID